MNAENVTAAVEKMTPRERVHAAAKGLPVDRVPVMYWLNPHTVCRLMSEFQPGHNLYWNWLANFLWRQFSKGRRIQCTESMAGIALFY